jgi:hypothetical protein
MKYLVQENAYHWRGNYLNPTEEWYQYDTIAEFDSFDKARAYAIEKRQSVFSAPLRITNENEKVLSKYLRENGEVVEVVEK